MQKEHHRLERWIFESYTATPQGLALLRIFSGLFLLFFLVPGEGTRHFAYLAAMPDDFYAPPPGPLMLLGGFPSLAVFQFLHTLLMLSLVGMLMGYRTKMSSILAGVSILLLQGFIFSVGKVNHEILVAVVPVVMAFSNWGAAFSVDAARKQLPEKVHSWPFAFIALLVAFMMFTAGFPKILGGWLDPSTQAVQGHLFNQFFVRERDALLAAWFVRFDNVLFWELLDWATVFFEVVFLAAVFSGVWFRRFVCLAVLFHFSTMILLNIAFLPNFLAYALFLNWNDIYRGLLKGWRNITGKKGEKSKKRVVWVFALITLIFFACLRYFSLQEKMLTGTDLTLHEVVIVSAGVVVVIALSFRTFAAKGTGR